MIPLSRYELLRLYRDSRRTRRCIAARIDDRACTRSGGRCHSVSRRAALEAIARDGHVYTLNSNLGTLFRTGGTLQVSERGVHRASTFFGLCSHHDTILFQAIDASSEEIGRERALMHLYRALCHEMYKKEWSIELTRLLEHRTNDASLLRSVRAGSAWAVLALMEHLERCERCIMTDGAGDICYEAFLSDVPPFVVASSVWFPDRDFHGSELQRVPQADHVPACLGLFVRPHAAGSVVLLVWHRDSAWCVQRLLHSLATAYQDAEIGSALLRMVLVLSENTFFAPSWWESLARPDQELYLRVWQRTVDLFDPVQPNHLRALDALPVDWPLSCVESCSDAE